MKKTYWRVYFENNYGCKTEVEVYQETTLEKIKEFAKNYGQEHTKSVTIGGQT